MAQNVIINTGEPRNVLGHAVSGAVASSIIAGGVNYNRVKKGEIKPNEALKETIKLTSQGAIATSAAIATANYLGQRNGLIKAVSSLSIGLLGIYAIEKLDEKINKKSTLKEIVNNE